MLKFRKVKLGECKYLQDKTSSNNKEKIEIVFATDNNYIQHMAAAMVSILLNSDNSSDFRFHILDGGIEEANRGKIEKLKELRGFEIIYYDMKKFDFSKFPLNRDYISVATYYRLLLLDILPNDVEKVIYLDCDLIVEKDIKELWQYDVSSYMAGVIEDEGSISQIKRLKLPYENNYFNAGILLLNIKNLRTFDFKNECIDYFNENEKIITLQDQDILNGVLNGKCKFLPLCWNANGRIYEINRLETLYTKEEAKEAKYNPAILHFTDTNKPWKLSCTHPLKNEYYKYLSYTEFNPPMFLYNLNRITHFYDIYRCFKFFRKNFLNIYHEMSLNGKYRVFALLGFKLKIKVGECDYAKN